ncbi:MAG: trigger factor [Wolbachia endosymbiont of Tyrophagus putrescentiae]|nr:trigger factor [Wolbachia endosymbiont of Tyrophagus putrescentiae]
MSDSVSQSMESVNSNDIYTYTEDVDGLEHKYEIIVNGQYIKQKVDSELQVVAKTAQLPGFRAGKTPYELIIKNYRDEVFRRILNEVIDYCYNDLIGRVKVKLPVNPKIDVMSLPDLDVDDERANLICKVSFELIPEVPVVELDKISLKEFEADIQESDVKEFIDSIKVDFPHFMSVDDSSYQARIGDNLIIDFEGRIRGKIFKGGNGKNFSIKLGSGTFIGGFEDQLVGMKKGEKKVFELQFPKDYHVDSLAEQEATFSVQVNDVQVIKEFSDDDEMARSMGFKDYSALVNYSKHVISSESKGMTNMLLTKELFNYLDATYDFDLPAHVVNQEQKRLGSKLEDSYKEAKRRVKLAMLLMKLGEERKILLSDDDIVSMLRDQYVSAEVSLEKALNRYKSDWGFRESVNGYALELKVTGYILENVSKEKQVISVKELKEMFNNV